MSEFQRTIQNGFLKPFCPTEIKEVTDPYAGRLRLLEPASATIYRGQCITLMPEYNDKSFEELRYGCYKVLYESNTSMSFLSTVLNDTQQQQSSMEVSATEDNNGHQTNGTTPPPVSAPTESGRSVYDGPRDLGVEDLFKTLKLVETPSSPPPTPIQVEMDNSNFLHHEFGNDEADDFEEDGNIFDLAEAGQPPLPVPVTAEAALSIPSPPAPAHPNNTTNNNPGWQVLQQNGSTIYQWSSTTQNNGNPITLTTPNFSVSVPDTSQIYRITLQARFGN